jgi:hypothetical protein
VLDLREAASHGPAAAERTGSSDKTREWAVFIDKERTSLSQDKLAAPGADDNRLILFV